MSNSRGLDTFTRNESGTIAVMFAVVIGMLLAAVGLSLTFLTGHKSLQHAQGAMDAAVLAAAVLPKDASEDERVAKALEFFHSNFEAQSGGSVTLKNVDISIWQDIGNFPGGPTVVTHGRVDLELVNNFSGFVGSKTLQINADAAARRVWSAPICLLSLNETASKGIEIYGNAELRAPTCAAQANSADGQGIMSYGMATGLAADFGVQGGFSGTGLSPQPQTGVPPTPDPFASVPFPPIGGCIDASNRLIHTVTTLQPGTYCGGLDLKALSDVTLEPGIYIMKDGPLDVNSNTRLFGRGVLIAFTGPDSTLFLGSGANVDLTSMASGAYANIQFYQDRDNPNNEWVTILGDVTLSYDGAAYFPGKDVWIGGGSVVNANSPGYAMVADQFWFQDSARINITQELRRNVEYETAAKMAKGVALIK